MDKGEKMRYKLTRSELSGIDPGFGFIGCESPEVFSVILGHDAGTGNRRVSPMIRELSRLWLLDIHPAAAYDR